MNNELNKMNNYEKWCEQWRVKFLDMDQNILLQRLPELKNEDEWLTIYHFGRKFGILKTDGKITAMEDHDPISCYEKLNIYTLFGYVSSLAVLKNNWVKFDQLKGASPFSKAFQEGITAPFGRTFSGHSQELEFAFKKLNAKKLSQADVGYEVYAFECIPIRFLFWEQDDEFSAQGNILFDAGATDYIHVESIVTIAAVALEKLAKYADLSLDRSVFPVF